MELDPGGLPELQPSGAGPEPARVARSLSAELERLIATFSARAVTLRELIVVLEGRAYDLLILFLALPFLLPIPMPGLSVAFGAVIALISARQMLGQHPWLPRKLLDVRLPADFLPKLLRGAGRVLRFLELFLRPRLLWLTAPPLPRLHALLIFVAAVVLALPLPPGTNLPPALVIVTMAGGLLERDGRFVLAAYVSFAFNIIFFALLAFYGTKILDTVWHWMAG